MSRQQIETIRPAAGRVRTYRTAQGCLVSERKVLNAQLERTEVEITLSTGPVLELVEQPEGRNWPNH